MISLNKKILAKFYRSSAYGRTAFTVPTGGNLTGNPPPPPTPTPKPKTKY